MSEKTFPKSQLPIRRTVELLPSVFRTETNSKFLGAVLDPLVQPGVLEKVTGYIGRRYGKTYNSKDVYLDDDETLRSVYQLEPGVTTKNSNEEVSFTDYIDLKNQIKFFGNNEDNDTKTTDQIHYTWNPPIDWDKFINYREYYWEPLFPPSVDVSGNFVGITSTYKVSLGFGFSYIFSPDGFTNNPTITLYRGQKYIFKINAPQEGFAIKTNYDTGSLLYNPVVEYKAGQLAVFEGKLWRALADIPAGDGSSINENSLDWQLVEVINDSTSLFYNQGVINNGAETGDIIFEVPFDAPDVLFYQSSLNADRFGRFIISNIGENTFIDIEKEILGKVTYTSSNGIEFSNGLVINFKGKVLPEKYSKDFWLIEGVGDKISLIRTKDLVPPLLSEIAPEVLFDNAGFDSEPFDDATAFPGTKDYITISRASEDDNPWSRYNRWFHRSILEYAYKSRGRDFSANENLRAKRPIIEFNPNLQLINHGSISKENVDYVDDFTDDVFSKIEGESGYNIDGEFLFEGARVLVIADTDSMANNKIYRVRFINHNGRKQIHLATEPDSQPLLGEGVLVKRGNINAGKMYHFTGDKWVRSQEKNKVNQSPLFDAVDEQGVSFSNLEKYPVSTFIGTKILSYKSSNTIPDLELGFGLSYLNIDNVGDIQFEWNWEKDNVTYLEDKSPKTISVSSGYYIINDDTGFSNGWSLLEKKYVQPIIDSVIVNNITDTLTLRTIDWDNFESDPSGKINFYLNGTKIELEYTRNNDIFIFNRNFAVGDVLSLKIISTIEPRLGYYEIPVGLEKNPLNQNLLSFTFGEAADHLLTSVEFDDDFIGSIPGDSNLRNISNYRKFGKRFLKHSGIAPLSLVLLIDKNFNAIKSIQYAKKGYSEFKNNFLIKASELETVENTADFVDNILKSLTKVKNDQSPFADCDMIGTGAYSSIVYEVEDEGIKNYALSEKFDLTELSRKAVYVYINGKQLLVNKDYNFNANFGFVTLLTDLKEGDVVEIREYVSSSFCFIPPTPTKLGLYKKYTPLKFIDDTYVEPKEVIQGHDGSITVTFGDYRDDLLLELEYRIYNNIKAEYNPELFDIDSVFGGFYGNAEFTKKQVDGIVIQEFLRWISNTNIGYTLNEYFDSENSFTYTYSNMTEQSGSVNLPGWWRGVYQWFYDTDRPHRCPWEMLGFSEQPEWWTSEYGPAPYTSNNLILWEDLRDGIIRRGERQGINNRYKRPTLLNHLPVDSNGTLLSPLDSGLANNFSLINNKGSFVFGDTSPVEYAWRSSSEWPFATIMALMLLKPFDFINKAFDLSRQKKNKIGQYIAVETNKFFKISDIAIPEVGGKQASGIVNYLVSYSKYLGIDTVEFKKKLNSIDVVLSSRISGFVDKTQQKYLLDSKSPKSTSSSIFIPPENYDIIFNVSVPVLTVSYSGVLIEKSERGWKIQGYDSINPFFNYFEVSPSQTDPLMTVGGVSANYTPWAPNRTFNNGEIVEFRNEYYRAVRTHGSGNDFDKSQWIKIPKLPVIGAVEALQRRNFNKFSVKKLSYGEEISTIQEVVDFMLGYEEYLKSLGLIFDQYDRDLKVSKNWITSAKEFMFWTRQNWDIGSLITLSPLAERFKIKVPVGVAESFLDSFYDYQILKNNGTPLLPEFINVNRDFQSLEVSTTNTTDGIYFLKAFFVIKENVVLFSDRTVFNDVIYEKSTGYRQERIKVQGFRTVDWDGDYTSPGFIFDNVDIKVWQPFTDYRLGDIVSYKSYNWVCQISHEGSEEFNNSLWSRLDSTPTKTLIPNFDYRINLFEDYFEIDSDGLGLSQRELSRHFIGYQTRNYLQNLSEDPVTQIRLYRGFIKEKGTADSITKVFNKLGESGASSVTINEEWAFRVGKLGGYDQLKEIEINLQKSNFLINPQPIIYVNSKDGFSGDRFYRVTDLDFTIIPTDKVNGMLPSSYESVPFLTAGYVKPEQVDLIVRTKESLLSLNINTLTENQNIWVTFEGISWNVYRFVKSNILFVVSIDKNNEEIVIGFNRSHSFKVGDIIGLKIENLTGFYRIVELPDDSTSTVVISVLENLDDIEFEPGSFAEVWSLTSARTADYHELDRPASALLANESKIWVDKDENGFWEVVQKTKQFSFSPLIDYGLSDPKKAGSKVLYDDRNKRVISSIPGSGFVMVYIETSKGLSLRQIISPPIGLDQIAKGSFGEEMAISPDYKWLAIASPRASGVPSNYKSDYDPAVGYLEGDVVLYEGKLWRALTNIQAVDGSTINIYSQDWAPADLIRTDPEGSNQGDSHQGFISLYEFSQEQWNFRTSFISPRPAKDEFFGYSVSIGKQGDEYTLAVSAPGAINSKGRVYLFEFSAGSWKMLENNLFKGVYDPSAIFYPKGSVVWAEGTLFKALVDTTGDGSTITLNSADWIKVDSVVTNSSLPQGVAIENDGSTLISGIIDDMQVAELVKEQDRFGTSITLSANSEFLIVGAPESDGLFFPNYKGIWRPDFEYKPNETVKYQGNYYTLVIDVELIDSSFVSYNQIPDQGDPWELENANTTDPLGKVFVYKRDINKVYQLVQTLTAGSLLDYSDLTSDEMLNPGDQFGYSMSLDDSGNYLVISSPKSNITFDNPGVVYVLKKVDNKYRIIQKLESYEENPNEWFGQEVCMSPNAEKIIVGAKNFPFATPVDFDSGSTTFDSGSTTFFDLKGYAGGVYVYEMKDKVYFLTEKLEADLSPFESFGYSIDCTSSVIVVGSPDFIKPTTNISSTTLLEFKSYEGPKIGNVRLFKKNPNLSSWQIIAKQEMTSSIDKIKGISLYDDINNIKLADLDIVDPAKFKILGIADAELRFKTEYDPAVYSVGTNEVIVDKDISWAEKHVGELWWDISKVKWLYYEQGDTSFRSSNWSKLAVGSEVQVCEWVESVLLPSEWAELADTTEGLSLGISGQPLYPNDDVYTVKILINPVNGSISGTRYYYWVRRKTVLPENNTVRKLSAAEVEILIRDPAGSGISFVGLSGNNTILAFNFDRILTDKTALLNLIFSKDHKPLNKIHNEYQIISEGVANDIPSDSLERKWIDSLIGFDQAGNRVPDTNLPAKQKYGISFRPRQSMFVDRSLALRNLITSVNSTLQKEPFADITNLKNLRSNEEFPIFELNLYDAAVDTFQDLSLVGTTRVKSATLKAVIVDSSIESIEIVDPGFGYRNKFECPINIDGDGTGAEAFGTFDNQGRLENVIIVNGGKKYTSASVSIRKFSVLVRSDQTQNGLWSIYSWDELRRVYFRTRSQSFEVSRFWKLVDWWKQDYSSSSRIVTEILGTYQIPLLNVEVGDLIRIKEYSNGGWAVFEKISEEQTVDFLNNWKLVGRENGTIEFSEILYDNEIAGVGFDRTKPFDTELYDVEYTKELRIILKSIKEDFFVNEYKVEWNNLFFNSIRYVLAEQLYVDWVFKTSLLRTNHYVGNLNQKLNYKNDNLESYIEYLNEVKPFRTTIRNYTSSYANLDMYPSSVTDFDLPPEYSIRENAILPIDSRSSSNLDFYPWKWWTDNNSYSVISINVVNPGSGYLEPPTVIIEGDGRGAKAQAFISNGKVVSVRVLDEGTGYYSSPVISLVGGNSSSLDNATAVAKIGNSKSRIFNIQLKFDRITKDGLLSTFNREETFIASGSTAIFDLKYPPVRDKSKIFVIVDDEISLRSAYSLNLFRINNTLKGQLVFNRAPVFGSRITVSYQINDDVLDSVNRINRYYNPSNGMKSRDLGQLMTGIDFGGVKVQGNTFEVTGGWDALPWFTDTWDSVEASSDFYYVVDISGPADSSESYKKGSIIKYRSILTDNRSILYRAKKTNIEENTNTVILPLVNEGWEEYWEKFIIVLPFVPTPGQRINTYLKKAGTEIVGDILNLQRERTIADTPTIRLDDPEFGSEWNPATAINPNAVMPTFIGDGSTTIIDITDYVELDDKDTLIFRLEDSDGAVTITDPTILDTAISGGSFGAYSTANGMSAEEIVIEGGQFVSPDQIQAPEEVVPGQTLDSFSIKVFDATTSGVAPLQSKIFVSNGTDLRYGIGLKIFESTAVLVYIDKVKQQIGINYEIDYITNEVFFSHPINQNSILEIISIGIGGISILDYQEFIADGETNLFLTDANFNETTKVAVTLDGKIIDASFVSSEEFIDTIGRTMVRFANNVPRFSVIKIICLGSSLDTDSDGYSIVRVNQQVFEYDGVSRKFNLDKFVLLTQGSEKSSVIVEVNNRALKSVDTQIVVYNGNNNTVVLGIDPLEFAGAILPDNIKVFVNGQLQKFIENYDYDGVSKVLTISKNILSQNDIIKIEVDLRTEYSFVNNDIEISNSVPLNVGDKIEVTWFSEYPTMDIIQDEFVGGKYFYKLKAIPLDISYVWVYKNGIRLTKDIDYSVSLPRGIVYLLSNDDLNPQRDQVLDTIKIVQFGSALYRDPVAYEIHKDMLNYYHYTRYSETSEIVLESSLMYYNTEIVVSSVEDLFEPDESKNIPGIIQINGEKISYFGKDGNRLFKLRRGFLGTSIAEIHVQGSRVVNCSINETIPYNENQEKSNFVSDGSSLLIGPLNYTPKLTDKLNWFRGDDETAIPIEYGPCNEIEVFVGGRRLRKDPISVYDENNGLQSPAADVIVPAEFSVDGQTPFVRLSETVPAGVRVTIIKRVGKVWYDTGNNSASSGITLFKNSGPIPTFIAKKNTRLPE